MINIAIDGPVSSGKSTLADKLAERLRIHHLNTGSMYRAFALYLMDQQVDINNEELISAIVKNGEAEVSVSLEGLGQKTYLNGIDVTNKLRAEELGLIASIVSQYGALREYMVEAQRDVAERNDVVLDGRDIGTVVLPDAELKIFLTASRETRAKRRYMELLSKGVNAEYDDVLRDLIQRDKQDALRKIAPLRQAEDAVLVDSTDLSFDETLEELVGLAEKVYGQKQEV